MYEYILSQNNPRDIFLCAVAVLCAIMVAIMVHEIAHGYVAKLNGDPTAQMMGRLSFNPVRHFDIWGVLMFLLVGFGWAKPVPVDPRNFKNLRKGIFTVSIAGVAANFLTAIASGGLIGLLMSIVPKLNLTDGSTASMLIFLISQFLIVSLILNIALIVFNLLPIYPLDGFRIVESFSRSDSKFVSFMRSNGIYVLFGLLIIGRFLGSFSPYLDPLGMYLSFMNNLLFRLISRIFIGM